MPEPLANRFKYFFNWLTRSGPLAILVSPRVSGKIARRLACIGVAIPLLLVFTNRYFINHGFYHTAIGDILLIIISIVLFGSIIIIVLSYYDKTERDTSLLFDLSLDMFCIAKTNGYFKKVNPAFTKTLGYTKAELLAKPYVDFILEEDREATKKAAALLNTGKDLISFSNRYRCKDGSVKWISWSAVPLIDEGVIFGAGRDITAMKMLEEKLQQANSNLAGKISDAVKAALDMEIESKAKSDFLANMSHELRTPMNAIIGFSDVLLRGMSGSLTEQQHEYLTYIHNSGNHLLSLINDLLDLAKIEAGKMQLEISQFNINEIITGAIALFKEKALTHQLQITADTHDHEVRISADERRIKQVIFNLLSNAVKFTPDQGNITVHLYFSHTPTGADTITVIVSDNGIGISTEDQKRLFRPFEQLETSYQKKYAGTGLGLSLCKNIIDLHHGIIWVESAVGKGSRFGFTIPRDYHD